MNTILNNTPALTIENDNIPLINGMGHLLKETSYNFSTQVLTYNDIEYPISREVFASKGLQQLTNELGKLTQNQVSKTLAVMSEGFLGEKQKRVYLSDTGQIHTTTTTTKLIETSEDWLPNRIKRFLAGGDASNTIAEFYTSANEITDKTTKSELLTVINNLINNLITEKDLEALALIKEEETILQRLQDDILLIDESSKVSIIANGVTIREATTEVLKDIMVLVNETYQKFTIGNMIRPTPLDPVDGFDIIKK